MRGRKILIPILISLVPFFLVTMIIIGSLGNVAPVDIVAGEETAYEYQYIGSELGVPWDIVMLVDAIHAKQEGKGEIDYNPLITSLEFCKVQEDRSILLSVPGEGGRNESVRVPVTSKVMTGADGILAYIGRDREGLDYQDAGAVIAAINEAARHNTEVEYNVAIRNGGDTSVQYQATVLSEFDYEMVLRDRIGLTESEIKRVMELYESQYLVYLYGYSSGIYDIILPEVVIGQVTRSDLAAVAAALINHPYLMGAKSSKEGPPAGPLDCSGYVDWVYIQCFGRGVSSGVTQMPTGVAVAGTAMQFYASAAVPESELKVGDLGFMYDPQTLKPGEVNHVGIYIGQINGQNAFIHCGGRYYGTGQSPRGRVGISVSSGTNNVNNVTGGTFDPAMNSCTFRYLRRPCFVFLDD